MTSNPTEPTEKPPIQKTHRHEPNASSHHVTNYTTTKPYVTPDTQSRNHKKHKQKFKPNQTYTSTPLHSIHEHYILHNFLTITFEVTNSALPFCKIWHLTVDFLTSLFAFRKSRRLTTYFRADRHLGLGAGVAPDSDKISPVRLDKALAVYAPNPTQADDCCVVQPSMTDRAVLPTNDARVRTRKTLSAQSLTRKLRTDILFPDRPTFCTPNKDTHSAGHTVLKERSIK